MGFVVALPVLVLGFFEAAYVPTAAFDSGTGVRSATPCSSMGMARLFLGPAPEGTTLAIGGLGLAGWFGLLLTGLNLLPIGQLDGGHVVYALVREKAEAVSRARLLGLRGARLFRAELARLGPAPARSWAAAIPRPWTTSSLLGRGRVFVALLGLVVFVVSFVPNPPSLPTPGNSSGRLFTSR